MNERERIHLRDARAAAAAEDEAERVERERPLREAEATFKETAKQLALLERDRVRTSKDGFQVDPLVATATMSFEQASRFNAESAARFVENTPAYYPSEANQQVLVDYLWNHNAQIANEATFKAAFERLNSYGLLEDWPAPDPDPEPDPEPAPEPIIPPSQRRHRGFDLSTGEEKLFTEHEVNRMSADELKANFRIPTATERIWR
jgi:hypothetical protein